jgi:hypothetical protein
MTMVWVPSSVYLPTTTGSHDITFLLYTIPRLNHRSAWSPGPIGLPARPEKPLGRDPVATNQPTSQQKQALCFSHGRPLVAKNLGRLMQKRLVATSFTNSSTKPISLRVFTFDFPHAPIFHHNHSSVLSIFKSTSISRSRHLSWIS